MGRKKKDDFADNLEDMPLVPTAEDGQDLPKLNLDKMLAPKTFTIKDFGSIDTAMMIESIVSDFKENVDYGYPYPNAKKKSLWKPGAEKVCMRFNLMPRYSQDQGLLDMMKIEKAIVYKCELVHRPTGTIIGEGTGVAIIGEKNQTPNTTVQMAQKRGFVAAVRQAFALSDRYTDEYDAPEQEKKAAMTHITIDSSGKVIEV